MPGIVFDTRVCVGAFFLHAGYRFRYPVVVGAWRGQLKLSPRSVLCEAIVTSK